MPLKSATTSASRAERHGEIPAEQQSRNLPARVGHSEQSDYALKIHATFSARESANPGESLWDPASRDYWRCGFDVYLVLAEPGHADGRKADDSAGPGGTSRRKQERATKR